MKTKVLLRDGNIFKSVEITSDEKPIISGVMELKWQRIINIIGRILNVPSGLIMKITKESMQVFIKSDDERNPYPVGGSDTLGHGLYCETVIGTNDELLIKNALKLKEWEDNPDVKMDMISYLGLPIKWPDQSFFGTICVLDSKENAFNSEYRELLSEFRDSLERDLEILEKNSQLEFLAHYDQLTTSYNRRKLELTLEYEYNRYQRAKSPYSVIIFDLDNFKSINDNYGHEVGDKVLIAFAEAVKSSTRNVDIFGRWGGDEFLLVCPVTNFEEASVIIKKSEKYIREKMNQVFKSIGNNYKNSDFSYGIATIKSKYSLPHEIVKDADDALYIMKSNKSNQ